MHRETPRTAARSILSYYNSTGTVPAPLVDSHAFAGQYVNCQTGQPYDWQDETDAQPIPNSIYSDASGFTHDYYSGTTAEADGSMGCLGITAEAWATGGPVNMAGENPAAITTHPVGVSIVSGSTTSFSAVVVGNPDPTLQWQVSDDGGATWTNAVEAPPYGGVTTATLTVSAAPATLNGRQYRLLAINSVGTATSDAATLTVTKATPTVWWGARPPLSTGRRWGQRS